MDGASSGCCTLHLIDKSIWNTVLKTIPFLLYLLIYLYLWHDGRWSFTIVILVHAVALHYVYYSYYTRSGVLGQGLMDWSRCPWFVLQTLILVTSFPLICSVSADYHLGLIRAKRRPIMVFCCLAIQISVSHLLGYISYYFVINEPHSVCLCGSLSVLCLCFVIHRMCNPLALVQTLPLVNTFAAMPPSKSG